MAGGVEGEAAGEWGAARGAANHPTGQGPSQRQNCAPPVLAVLLLKTLLHSKLGDFSSVPSSHRAGTLVPLLHFTLRIKQLIFLQSLPPKKQLKVMMAIPGLSLCAGSGMGPLHTAPP